MSEQRLSEVGYQMERLHHDGTQPPMPAAARAARRGVLLRTVRSLPLDPLPFRRAEPPYRDVRNMLPKGR